MPQRRDTQDEEKNTVRELFERISISETVIIAAIPFAAYTIVFFYEWGYFSFFQIPIEFVSFDLGKIFIALISVVGFIALFYYCSNYFIDLFGEQPPPVRRKLEKAIYPFMFAATLSVFIISDWKWGAIVIGILAVISFMPFLIPLITQRKVKGYLGKLIAEDKIESKKNGAKSKENDLLQKVVVLLGRRTFLGLFLFAFLLYTTYQLGNGSARTQKDFRVVSTMPERVVVWIYGDYAICSSFDRTTKQVDSEFVILKIGDDPNIEYRLEQVGPLKRNSGDITIALTSTPSLLSSSPTLITFTPQANETPENLPSAIATKTIIRTDTPALSTSTP